MSEIPFGTRNLCIFSSSTQKSWLSHFGFGHLTRVVIVPWPFLPSSTGMASAMFLARGIKSGLALFDLAVFPDGPAENCIVVFLGH